MTDYADLQARARELAPGARVEVGTRDGGATAYLELRWADGSRLERAIPVDA